MKQNVPESAEVYAEGQRRNTGVSQWTPHELALLVSTKFRIGELEAQEGLGYCEPLGDDWPRASSGDGQPPTPGQVASGKHEHPWGVCYVDHAKVHPKIKSWAEAMGLPWPEDA